MRKRGAIKRRVALMIAMTMLASMMVVPAPASAAAGAFTGGPDQWPTHIANDHTPIAVHYSADGSTMPTLTPNTTYFVKVRFTVNTTPSGSTNRGYTWNPATGRWAQEREDWINFPTVTTDGTGSISNNAGWAFAKFGDDAKSGQYHLMISLSSVGDSSTFNGSFVPTVTVFDPRTTGGWVHNGIAVASNKANKNVRVTDETSTTVLALQKSEQQLVDDDSNGTADDEDFGPAGAVADFRMAVPATASTIMLNLNQSFWPAVTTTFTTGPADTDVAIGAQDMTAPTAPGALQVASGDENASVWWLTPATDDTGIAGYYVYRWSPAPAGAAYSPVHTRIATLAPDATEYNDTGLTNGQTYLYEVRAFDAATNVGPRSGPATATPQVAAPSASVSPLDPDGLEDWYVTAPVVTLTSSAPDRQTMYSFEGTASAFTTYTVPVTAPNGVSRLYYYDTDGTTSSGMQWLDFKTDTAAPTAKVSAPLFSVLHSTTGNYSIGWSGADAGSGIAGYDVDVRTGLTGSWRLMRRATASTSTVFAGTAGSCYYFRVRSIDVAGRTGAWVTSNSSKVPYDQTKGTFSSGWSTLRRSASYLGGAKYTTRSGAYANFTLSKGVLYVVTTTGPKYGKFAVYYRGRRVTTIDTYSKTTKYRQVFQIATYAKGSKPSAVKIVNLATRNRPRIEVDGFALRW